MRNAFVSIIMATYNNANYLQEAINSVLHQSYKDFELIIINDASTDSTAKIVSAYAAKDDRITIITNEKKQGLTTSLNIGISRGCGEYIARLDSDDVWSNQDKLQKQVKFLKNNPQVGIVGCWGHTIDISGKINAQLQYPVSDRDIRKYLLIENCFIHSGILLRKVCVDNVGGYDVSLKYAQDYDLWLRIGRIAEVHNLPEFMVFYRKNPEGISKRYYHQQIAETMYAVRKHGSGYAFQRISLLLWKIRLYIPYSIREYISEILRKILFYSSFQMSVV